MDFTCLQTNKRPGILLIIESSKDRKYLERLNRVIKTYNAAVEGIQDLQYDQNDIEELCIQADNFPNFPYMILGPAGGGRRERARQRRSYYGHE